MDIILVLFIAVVLVSLRFGENYAGLHDRSSLTALRGMMAIAIILHHLSERTTSGHIFNYLVHIGYLIVSVFLFLSGYGLMTQLKRKKRVYLKGFWAKRVLPLVVIYLLTTALYVVVKAINGCDISVGAVLLSFVNGFPVAMNSWYIIVQILLYTIFELTFIACGNRYKIGLAIVMAVQSIMVFIFRAAGYSSIWYLSNFSFTIGLIWAYYDDCITKVVANKWLACAFGALLSFTFFSGLPLVIVKLGGNRVVIGLLCRFASTVSFAIFVALLACKIRFVGKLWLYLGERSLEIYLLHGAVYYMLRSNLVYVGNEVLWSIFTVIVAIAVSIPANKLNTIIKRKLSGNC